MNTELVAPIFNFSAVGFILFWFGKKPIADYLVSRSETIAKQITEGEKLSAEAEKQLSEWETNWKLLESHAAKAMEDAKQLVARLRDNTVKNARGEAERIQKDAKLVAQGETLKAKERLGHEVVDKSLRMAAQYLKTHVEDADRKKLAAEYMEKLVNGET